MAKGKQSLKDTLCESQITKTDEEVGNVPFWSIDDNYGVYVNQYGFELSERKEMNRSVKDDDGNIVGAETYYAWGFCKGAASFEDALLTYAKLTERKLFSKLSKCKDFRELVKIRLQIQKTINDSFKLDGLNKNVLNACNTIESHQELELRINEVNNLMDDTSNKCNDFMEFMKEKRSIIIRDTEPKKHKMKLEE